MKYFSNISSSVYVEVESIRNRENGAASFLLRIVGPMGDAECDLTAFFLVEDLKGLCHYPQPEMSGVTSVVRMVAGIVHHFDFNASVTPPDMDFKDTFLIRCQR